ncbi:MAG: CHRD domain-containing protein [Planctomycetes bacterium]|nr:CHRD domain-containing protein [Planctomycetota bacterium]MBI3844397.1 CHRD domain-containing protein [Planctomycetota bacterium]
MATNLKSCATKQSAWRRRIGIVFTLVCAAAGAARGNTSYDATLDGAQVSPMPLTVPGTGLGTFELWPDNTLIYEVNASPIDTNVVTTTAEIRVGDWGMPGTLVVPLLRVIDIRFVRFHGQTRVLTSQELGYLLDNRLFVTIKTQAHPDGEIRGQIVRDEVLVARRGNVNAAGVGPLDTTLYVGGTAGDPTYRRTTRPAGPTNIGVKLPTARGNGLYAIWVFPGEPTVSQYTSVRIPDGRGGVESIGGGVFCLPVMNALQLGTCACPAGPFPRGFTSIRLSLGAAANVCLNSPPPYPPAQQGSLVNIPITFPVGTYTVCGIIFDPASSTTGPRKVSLTNAVIVRATP